MAAAASIVVTGTIGSLPGGSRTIGPLTLTSAAASGVVQQTVLQSGDNTITLPTNITPSGCIIVLPSSNTALTTLKGAGGDTGIAIGKTGYAVLNWETANKPASFILNSAATQTGLTTEILFW